MSSENPTSELTLTITSDMRAAYEDAAHRIGGDGAAEEIVRRGLALLQEAGEHRWRGTAPVDVLKRLAQTRAMLAAMLVEAVILKRRLLDLQTQRLREGRRTHALQAEFQSLQQEAAQRDPSLLDLRPDQ